MNYCSSCGAVLQRKIPPGDNRPRFVCGSCNTIYYQNPKIVTGCLAEWENKVLMCRRAIIPRQGLWTLPAGFMENDETVVEAAIRETYEEANASVEIIDLFTIFNLPHVNQVYMMFRARLRDLNYCPGEESLEVDLFDETQIPWDRLAFATIHHTLRFYFHDRQSGHFGFHMGDIIKIGDQTSLVERRSNLPTEFIPTTILHPKEKSR
ncbi:MAG TPA: NUDIX hydrolase [Gammaproteobacteria bacterium]|jgi:ADP-ribose pyrophosphatase YjhB (NUDIX family)|nr:NUDIX hydrolase [Gammaproteobacteria bacterium]